MQIQPLRNIILKLYQKKLNFNQKIINMSFLILFYVCHFMILKHFKDLQKIFFWQFYKENSCFMNQGLYLTHNYQNQDKCRKI
jgi:hypothetical protein